METGRGARTGSGLPASLLSQRAGGFTLRIDPLSWASETGRTPGRSVAHLLWRSVAGRFIGRSDPDTSYQRGRSFAGASLWCRLGPACVYRASSGGRGGCPGPAPSVSAAIRRGRSRSAPVAPGPAQPTMPNRSRCGRDDGKARDWFPRMGIAAVAIQLRARELKNLAPPAQQRAQVGHRPQVAQLVPG
jgi:hypothetical protein